MKGKLPTFPIVRSFILINYPTHVIGHQFPYVDTILRNTPFTQTIYNEWVESGDIYLRKKIVHKLSMLPPAGARYQMLPFTFYDGTFHTLLENTEFPEKNETIYIGPSSSPKLLK